MKSALSCLVLCFSLSSLLFGAVPGAQGNGVTDDTAAIQAAIDSLPAFGVLDGGGLTYMVGTLRLKSQMTMENFQLKTKPSTVPLTNPVTLDGTKTPISDVNIIGVNVDGNRAQQTNLVTIEDGGRSGFRIVGIVANVWITRSSAVNCATDGLQIFFADTVPPAGTANFTNIVISASHFDNNRRHGVSMDSIHNVQFLGVTFNNNGLPVDTKGRTPTEGESAYLVGGALFGAGLVFEDYTPTTGLDGLSVVGSTATGNARFGIQFWVSVSPNAVGFTTRKNIRIDNTVADGGVSPQHGRQAIEFNMQYLGQGFAYQNVTISNSYVNGTLIMNGISTLRITGGAVDSPYYGFYGASRYSQDVVIQGVTSNGKAFAQL